MQDAKDAVNFQANAMATAYGKELNVSADDILWGMGQVNFHATMLETLTQTRGRQLVNWLISLPCIAASGVNACHRCACQVSKSFPCGIGVYIKTHVSVPPACVTLDLDLLV